MFFINVHIPNFNLFSNLLNYKFMNRRFFIQTNYIRNKNYMVKMFCRCKILFFMLGPVPTVLLLSIPNMDGLALLLPLD